MDINDRPLDSDNQTTATPAPENDAPASSQRSLRNQSSASQISRLGVLNPPDAQPVAAGRGKTTNAAKPGTKTATSKPSRSSSKKDVNAIPAQPSSSNPPDGLGLSGSAAMLGELHTLRVNVSDGFDTIGSQILAVGSDLRTMTKKVESIQETSRGMEHQLEYIADDAVHTAEDTASLLRVARDSARDIHSGLETLQQLDVPREVQNALGPLMGVAERLAQACGEAEEAAQWSNELGRAALNGAQGGGNCQDSHVLPARMEPPSGPSSPSRARTFSGRDSPDFEHRLRPSFTLDSAARDNEPVLLSRMANNQRNFGYGRGRGRGMRGGGPPYGGAGGFYRQ